jgi:hypothetical protein
LSPRGFGTPKVIAWPASTHTRASEAPTFPAPKIAIEYFAMAKLLFEFRRLPRWLWDAQNFEKDLLGG